LKYYTKSIELDPKSYETLKQRGNCYHRLRKFAEAISDFSMAIKLNPLCEESYYSRGVCRYLLDNYQLAINDFEKAKEINPQNPEYSKMINHCYLGAVLDA